MSRAGRLLLAEGLVTKEQLEEAARQQSLSSGTIGLHLVRAGAVREGALTAVFCTHLGLEEVTDEELQSISPETAALLPRGIAVVSRVVPLELLDGSWLSVAMSDPTDDRIVGEIARITGLRVRIKVAPESELSLTLERLYGTSRPCDLPEWNDVRETRPTGPPSLEEEENGREPEPSTARRFRAPVVLEGRYERIPPDELPPDAEAGYFPLTQVKRRPPGTQSSEPVIQVKTVAVGTAASGGTTQESEVAQGLERLGRLGTDGARATPAPRREEPRPRAARPSRSASAAPPPTPSPPAQLIEADTWDVDEEGADAELSASRSPGGAGPPRRQAPRRPSDKHDTLIDLPKVDASHWSGSSATPLEEFVRNVNRATSRDEAIQVALSFMAAYCRRAAFFVLKRGVVEGFDALGPNLSLDQVRSIWIPLSSRSSLCEAVASKSVRIGPIGDTRIDAIFCAALGGRKGDSIIVPIVLGPRVVGVLYGDDLRGASAPKGDIEAVAHALGEALGRMVVLEKKKGSP